MLRALQPGIAVRDDGGGIALKLAARGEVTAPRRCAFGLAMLASVGAGAALTLAWEDAPKSALPEPLARERNETIVARAPAPRPEPLVPARQRQSVSAVGAPAAIVPPSPINRPQPESAGPVEPTARRPAPMSRSLTAHEVRSWRYQLQNIDPAAVARAPDDLVVIDYGGDSGPFSEAQVAAMRRKPDGARRLVLAYLSIGEAENYRFYWASAWRRAPPSWLGKENPSWRNNYAVRFWDAAWQDIVFDYAERIVAAGFDGVYLDKVDAFETMGRADAMVDFVARLAARVKAKRSEFLVISQNGDALIRNPKFRNAIDGFAREDLFFGEDRDGARNAPESIRASIARLKLLAAEHKPVFVVEYPRGDEQARTARREIAALGFIGLTARRALDKL